MQLSISSSNCQKLQCISTRGGKSFMGLKFRKLWDIFFCYILFKTWLVKTFYTTWYCTRQDRKQKQHIFEEPLMYQKLCIYMQAQNSFRSDMLKPSNPRERNMQNISRRYDSFLQFQGNLLKIYISILITSSKNFILTVCIMFCYFIIENKPWRHFMMSRDIHSFTIVL